MKKQISKSIYDFINFNRNIIFSIISNIAPGIPSSPTNKDVKIFSPIWKLNPAPIRFIIYIKIPPNTELITSLKTLLKGTANTFPIIKRNIMHAKKVITLLKSIFIIHPFPSSYYYFVYNHFLSVIILNGLATFFTHF